MTAPPVLDEIARVDDPGFYDTARASDIARLRNEAPVYRYESGNVWVVSKYDDLKYILREPQLFTSSKGLTLNDAKFGESIADSFYATDAELLLTLDPPRHREVRRVLAPAFTPRAIAAMETSIRRICREVIAGLPDGPFNFVTNVAQIIPIRVIGQLLGVPADEVDVQKFVRWSDELVKMGHPLSREELAVAAANTAEVSSFLSELIERKRANPGDDLISVMVSAELDNAQVSEANIIMLAITVLVGGNETTRDLLASCMWALAHHPEQMALLAADRGLVDQTVEEVLRWMPPAPGFLRNATEDVELRGQKIAQGDYVYGLFMAANRDEDHWQDPDVFDITRVPDPNVLSFSFGPHVCIGAALARLEVRCFLDEFLKVFTGVSVVGETSRTPSTFTWSWSDLPVLLPRL